MGKIYNAMKSSYKNRKQIVSTGKQMYKDIKMLKQLINVERKYIDTNINNTFIGPANNMYQLSAVSEGSDYNQRNGISIKTTSLQCRYNVVGNGSANVTNVRIIIFVDKESGNGTAPVWTDLLENTASLVSPLNHTNTTRFKILMDKLHTFGAGGVNGYNGKEFRKIKQHIKFSNTTTGRDEGHIYVLAYSDQAINNPYIDFYARLRFVDN